MTVFLDNWLIGLDSTVGDILALLFQCVLWSDGGKDKEQGRFLNALLSVPQNASISITHVDTCKHFYHSCTSLPVWWIVLKTSFSDALFCEGSKAVGSRGSGRRLVR